MPIFLCGDIGGTKTRLAIFSAQGKALSLIAEQTFISAEFPSLEALVGHFLAHKEARPEAACFGVAGPVVGRVCKVTNLPWVIDADVLQTVSGVPKVQLLNDLEATAWGLRALEEEDLLLIQSGSPSIRGNQAVIAAGTGLGEAGIVCDCGGRRPFASEGGHADFAARTPLEFELAQFARERLGFASWEVFVSGPGLVEIYRFLRRRQGGDPSPELAQAMAEGDPAAAISRAAAPYLEPFTQPDADPICVEAMLLFTSLYGAEAGNLALKHMATGGLYVAGGIAPRILPWLRRPEFIESFRNKGKMRHLMESMPVYVVLNDRAALLGPAVYLTYDRPQAAAHS